MAHANPVSPDTAPGQSRRRPRKSRLVRLLVLAVIAAMLSIGTPATAFAQSPGGNRDRNVQDVWDQILGFLNQFRPRPRPRPPVVTPPTVVPSQVPSTPPSQPPTDPSEEPSEPAEEPSEPAEEPSEEPSEQPSEAPTTPPAPPPAGAPRIIGTAVDNLALTDPDSVLVDSCEDTGLPVTTGGVEIVNTTSCIELGTVVRPNPVVSTMRNFTVEGDTVTFNPVVQDSVTGEPWLLDAFTVDPVLGGAGDTHLEGVGIGDRGHEHVGVVALDEAFGLPLSPTYNVFSAIQSFAGDRPITVEIGNLPPGNYRVDIYSTWSNHQWFVPDSANTTMTTAQRYFTIEEGAGEEEAPEEEAPAEEAPEEEAPAEEAPEEEAPAEEESEAAEDEASEAPEGTESEAPVATPTVNLRLSSGDVIIAPHLSYFEQRHQMH